MREPARKLLNEAENRAEFFCRLVDCYLGLMNGAKSLDLDRLSNTEGEQLRTDSSQNLTELLRRSTGDERALPGIVEFASPELQRISQRCLGCEQPLHTL